MVFLAGCTALAAPGPKPNIKDLPAVELEKPAEQSPRKKSALSPEVQEFMQYTQGRQKQALTYLKKWSEGVSR